MKNFSSLNNKAARFTLRFHLYIRPFFLPVKWKTFSMLAIFLLAQRIQQQSPLNCKQSDKSQFITYERGKQGECSSLQSKRLCRKALFPSMQFSNLRYCLYRWAGSTILLSLSCSHNTLLTDFPTVQVLISQLTKFLFLFLELLSFLGCGYVSQVL